MLPPSFSYPLAAGEWRRHYFLWNGGVQSHQTAGKTAILIISRRTPHRTILRPEKKRKRGRVHENCAQGRNSVSRHGKTEGRKAAFLRHLFIDEGLESSPDDGLGTWDQSRQSRPKALAEAKMQRPMLPSGRVLQKVDYAATNVLGRS